VRRLKITLESDKLSLQHKSLLLLQGKKVIVAKICSKEKLSHNLPPCLICGHYTTGGGKMQ
jgi:hypothetical protein